MDTYLYQFQFIMLGHRGVGKSSLLQSFATGRFEEEIQSTVGIDFHTRTIEIDRHNFKLQLWDTAGQERFRAVVRPYFRNAVGAVLVFDISDPASFDVLPELVEEVHNYSKPDFPFLILVGNKCDDSMPKVVEANDALQFASSHNIDYVETSAKTGKNIDKVFHKLTRKIYEAIQDGSIVVDEQWRGIKKGNELLKDLPKSFSSRRISNVPVDIAIEKKAPCC